MQSRRRGRRNGIAATVHGLRSSFGEWAFEIAGADISTIDLCLTHKAGSAVTRLYVRTDRCEQCGALMQAWGEYLYPDGLS